MKARLTKECIDKWFEENPGVPLKIECDDNVYSASRSRLTVLAPLPNRKDMWAILDMHRSLITFDGAEFQHYPSPYAPEIKKLYAYRNCSATTFSTAEVDNIYDHNRRYDRAPEYDIEYPNDTEGEV